MKFPKRNTQAQQREAVAQGRSLSPYRLRYNNHHKSEFLKNTICQKLPKTNYLKFGR
ncbi:MAG: hypothetical protein LBJ00_11560 [Planctomycetaceae bacterium]|nr:hypothetical protein [Planctomycetaceae bacterium]